VLGVEGERNSLRTRKPPTAYRHRTYRAYFHAEELHYFPVKIKETDLFIGVRRERFSAALVALTEKTVVEERRRLEAYIAAHPWFLESLEPCPVSPEAPPIASMMAEAAAAAGVGPMAAVAGAFAAVVGRLLTRYSREVIVENGGDLFLKTTRRRTVGIFAGASPLSHRVALQVLPEQTPLGICTSSASVGHSLSMGEADAVVILAPSVALADAVATAAGNLVRGPRGLEKALVFAQNVPGVRGAVVIRGEKLGAWGEVKLVPARPEGEPETS